MSGLFDPPKDGPMAKPAAYARKVPIWIRLPLIFIPFGVTIYWLLTESGIYLAIAEFQASFLDGEHYIVLSFLGALIVMLVPAAVIVQVLGRYYAKRDQDPPLES